MFLVAIPILGIGLYIIVNRSHPYFEKVFHIYDDLNGVVQENLTGIRVVKSFIREKFEIKNSIMFLIKYLKPFQKRKVS